MKTNSLDLNFEKPYLKIQAFSSNLNTKENIEKIYEEINKEKKALNIEKQKDEKYREWEKSLEKHLIPFSKFQKNVGQTIKKMKKKQKSKSQESFKINPKNFVVNEASEEMIILREIKSIKPKHKAALLEFYKYYLDAAKEKKRLFNDLKEVSNEVKNLEETIDIQKMEKNIRYIKTSDWSKSKIDLSQENKNLPPKNLLSKPLFNFMKKKFEELNVEIDNFGNDIQYVLCTALVLMPSYLMGENPCNNKIYLLKENQNILENTVEFTMLLQLLRDMKQLPEEKFEIVYDQEKKKI